MTAKKKFATALGVLLLIVLLAAAGGTWALFAGLLPWQIENERPAFIVGSIDAKYYDGVSDDLLTGGAGLEGLMDPKPPGFYDNFSPRVDDLRKNALHGNYRGLHDTTEAGGFGRLMGPNIGPEGENDGTDGTIAGWEYIAFEDDGDPDVTANVTMMVQVPDSFDPEDPCIVTAPSSGSRGVYGAVGNAGDWGLKRGCAVAYTDKGTGSGVHYLHDNTVNTMLGQRMDARVAGEESNFTAPISDSERYKFNREKPYRLAFKHAHSRQNAEAKWGQNVLHAVEFAFYVLNAQYGTHVPLTDLTIKKFTPENTLVIGFGISNGGGAVMRAAEQDTKGLLDGVAVSEPTLQLQQGGNYSIRQGETRFGVHSKPLYDFTTFQSLYQPCASLAKANRRAPFNILPRPLGQARCKALAMHGLLKGETLDEQAEEAQQKIQDYGFLEEQNALAPSHMAFDVYPNIAVNYAYAYGRFDVTDDVCGYSFAAIEDNNQPGPIKKEMLQTMFATGTGIPPTNSVQIIYDDAANGPIKHVAAVSKSTGLPDMALDGALCLRSLATGIDPLTGKPVTGKLREQHLRVKAGMDEMRNSGKLHGIPVVIVNGRSDAVLPPNHNSRAYYAMNKIVDGSDSPTRYYEIKNAQHLDVLLQFPGYQDKFVPIHWYAIQGANLLWHHLRDGEPLPPSQVVEPTTRERGEALTRANLPDIKMSPAKPIKFSGNELRIPE